MMKTILFLVFTLVCSSSGELFTALAHLENVLHAEREIAQELRHYVTKQTNHLQKLLKLADDFEQHSNDSLADPERHLGNPVNAYLLIKRFTADWDKLVNQQIASSNADAFMASIISKTVAFPDMDDLSGAAEALLRAQDTYALDTHQIAVGNLMGVRDSPSLSADDCFRLGAVAYANLDYYHTVMWITEAMKVWNSETEKTIDKPTLLDFLAYSLYMQGNVRHAMKLTQEWLQLEPSHDRASANLQYYNQMLSVGDNHLRQHQHQYQSGDVEDEDEPLNQRPADSYKSSSEYLVYERLCRGERTHRRPGEHRMSCRYRRHHPVLYIKPAKEETMHLRPRIVMYHDAVTPSEMAVVRSLAKPKLERSVVYHTGPAGTFTPQNYRISKSAWLSDWENKSISHMSQRSSAIANLTLDSAELMQVVNYGIAGQYEPHYDFSQRREMTSLEERDGTRIATFLCYVADTLAGGATVFPEIGVTLYPKMGSCVLWFNLHKSGAGDFLTRHAGCPVLSGTKWICNKWFHERGQEFVRRCDVTPDN